MTIPELQRRAWESAQAKGLHDDLDAIDPRTATLVRLALIHADVSEATHLVKRQASVLPAEMTEALADAMIRIADLAECLELGLDSAIEAKLRADAARPRLYGTPWDEKA